MYIEFMLILKVIAFCFFLASVLLLLSIVLVWHNPDREKRSSYECGFNPWGDARSKFEVRFYLVAILFLIFDLEILFLYPWLLSNSPFSLWSLLCVLSFLFVLTVGFIYEWAKGALDWE